MRIDLPRVDRKRLPSISAEDAKKLLAVCEKPREKALVLLLLDSGLRRGEASALNWGDMNLNSGLVRIRRGKGGKARSVVIGATTRRAILRYRRTIPHDINDPVFQSERGGGRLTGSGLRGTLKRLGKRAGVEVTVHAFRRGFAALSLRAGMSPLHLQGLLGHSSLEMVRHYV